MAVGMKRIFITKLTDVSSSDKEGVGTVRREGDAEYIYCKGVASTIAGSVVYISDDGSYNTALLTTAAGAAPRRLAVAKAAIGNNQYGWYQTKGYCASIAGLASCAASAALYTSGTDGYVDDDSASQHAIHGMVFNTAVGGSNGVTDGMLDHPWTTPQLD